MTEWRQICAKKIVWTKKLANEMKELLKNYSQDKSNLIQILNEVQEKVWLHSKTISN